MWNQVKAAFSGSQSELFANLDEFIVELQENEYLDVTGTILETRHNSDRQKGAEKVEAGASIKLSPTPDVSSRLLVDLLHEEEVKQSQNYSKVFIQIFKIRELISRFKEASVTLNIKHIYIFIDDFSELPQSKMKEVVDTILAPFNNWSDEFIKLKIAIYPGRLYSGDIDISKVDEIYLDIYRAYGRNDINSMEERAMDFIQRLITTRTRHFCQDEPDIYFDTDSSDLWRTLFYSCLGNPRILGYILNYCYETSLIYDKRIGVKIIQDASRRYYEEKVGGYFQLNKFLHETFEERSSIYSLKELFEALVSQSKKLRSYKGSRVMKELSGRPPTSHFHIFRGYELILSSLELNFFLTKYFEMKDRDGREVTVYALVLWTLSTTINSIWSS